MGTSAVLFAMLVAVAPTPVSSASPVPSVSRGLRVSATAAVTVISQNAAGPGTVFPRSLNLPFDPETPYDFFTSTPGAAGNGMQSTFTIDASYAWPHLAAGLSLAAESTFGSNTNVLYLGEPSIPTVNPFVSSRSMLFVTYLGATDPVSLARSSVISGWIGAPDESWNVRGGWFLPARTLPFVFAPPPLPNALPAVAPQIPELAEPAVAPLQNWKPQWAALPLQGVDATARSGRLSYEFFDGALPTVYFDQTFNDSARVASLALAYAPGNGSRFSLQAIRSGILTLGGINPISAAVMWGDGLETGVGPEGPQPESDVFGQHATVVGFQALLQPNRDTTVVAETGRSWFSAQLISAPGRPTPGSYYHMGAERHWRAGRRLSIDLYRFEPTYAPSVLPYGNVLNNWPVAWSWPSNWLKGDYQLVANDEVSINRQGFRVRYGAEPGRFSYDAGYAQFAQVTPYNATTAFLPGFTDPFFTSLQDASLSYRGIVREYTGVLAWHFGRFALSVEGVDDLVHRSAAPQQPSQAISLEIPQTIVALSQSSANGVYAVGEGRFGIFGCYALCGTADVDIAQRVYFAGANVATGSNSAVLFQWQRFLNDGVPIAGFPVPPRYTGTRMVLELRERAGEL